MNGRMAMSFQAKQSQIKNPSYRKDARNVQ